jgi:hypothetical protein
MTLDRNAPLPFKLHVIKNLVLIFSFRYCIGYFKQTVRQGAFTMVDMSYNAEVADIMLHSALDEIRCKYIKYPSFPSRRSAVRK